MHEKSTSHERAGAFRRWFKYRWRRVKRLPLGVQGALVGMAIVSSVAGFRGTEQGWKGLSQNLGPELAGAVVIYVPLDLLLGTRQRKEVLIGQMGSDSRDVAVPADDELSRQDWLYDGSLNGAWVSGANLQGANHIDQALISTIPSSMATSIRQGQPYASSWRSTVIAHRKGRRRVPLRGRDGSSTDRKWDRWRLGRRHPLKT